MDKEIKFLEQLLYNTDKNYIINYLTNTNNSLLLHYFAANYNWNNGFDIPTVILENKSCDFGTGLLMFHYADGYRMMENPDEVSRSSSEEWKDFLGKVYNKLMNLEFKSQNISFDPDLTKIQKYKLKKSNPNIPDILINSSPVFCNRKVQKNAIKNAEVCHPISFFLTVRGTVYNSHHEMK